MVQGNDIRKHFRAEGSHTFDLSALLSARRLGALWFSQIHACALAPVAD